MPKFWTLDEKGAAVKFAHVVRALAGGTTAFAVSGGMAVPAPQNCRSPEVPVMVGVAATWQRAPFPI